MRKIVIVLTLILASLVTVFGQDFNNNVTFKKRTHLKGRTVVLDTCLTIRSGNDSVVISIRKDSVFIKSSTAGFVFTPPLPSGSSQNCFYDTVITLDSTIILNSGTQYTIMPSIDTNYYYSFTDAEGLISGNVGYTTDVSQTSLAIVVGDTIIAGGPGAPSNTVFRILSTTLSQTSGLYTFGKNSANSLFSKGSKVIVATTDGSNPTGGNTSIKLYLHYQIINSATGKPLCY